MDAQRKHQIEAFVRGLDQFELRALYHELSLRMREVHRIEDWQALQAFRVLDRVAFHHGGQHIEGTVVRVNQRTVSVVTADNRRWTVSPQYLRKLEPSAAAAAEVVRAAVKPKSR
ncbi:MAG TPA: hypothetical protein VI322_03685 [Candidatus Saccharimonadia bacterium]